MLSAPFMGSVWIVFCVARVSGQRPNNAEGESCFRLRNVGHLQVPGARSQRGLCGASPGEQETWGTSPVLRPQLKKKVENVAW